MRLVVADTSPLNYLILIGQIEIRPALFEMVFVPQIVQNELRHDEAGTTATTPIYGAWTMANVLRSCLRSEWKLIFC